jgi:hypothetical protein
MKKIISVILGLICILIFVSCAPSSEQIANAVKATIDAQPTEIPTAAIILTPTTAPTSTIVPTPSPIPDTRIAIAEPRKLVLTKADLPKEGDYIIPNETWSSPTTNNEIIQWRGTDEGSKYLSISGRVVGWSTGFLRRTKGVGAQYPIEIDGDVIQYKSAAGARFVLQDNLDNNSTDYKSFDMPNGDMAIVYKIPPFTSNPDASLAGTELEGYEVLIQHRNYVIDVTIFGIEGSNQVSRDFAVEMAMKSIDKIDQADLYPSWPE